MAEVVVSRYAAAIGARVRLRQLSASYMVTVIISEKRWSDF